ncbi:hypothetical protein N8612_05635 [Verrucomicrobia bacterium]|nr:hypothetical protein [Verrucomicrobiota bacterium]
MLGLPQQLAYGSPARSLMGVMPSASQCSLVFDLPSGLSIFGGERRTLGEAQAWKA